MYETARAEALSGFFGFLSGLRISETQANDANRLRNQLLDRLRALNVGQSSHGSKLFSGTLSPGCLSCGAGTWSCTYLTRQCTADCFFCPTDPNGGDPVPRTSRILLPGLEGYLAYLRHFGFQGVSFSGGEPLLCLEEMLRWIAHIRREFGSDIYLWVYTNGDLLDRSTLRALHLAGLDEIRVNIAARGYALDAVRLAREVISTVTVEIPCIPEDLQVLQERLVDLQGLGMDHVNLHQLFANQANYRSLAGRGYTFLPLMGTASAVLESEITALRLLLFGLENRIDVPINYCSLVYRTRYDNLAHRRRAGTVAARSHDCLTEAGYLRTLSVSGSSHTIGQIEAALQAEQISPALWHVADGGSHLEFEASLLGSPTLARQQIDVQYYEAEVFSDETALLGLYEPTEKVEPGPGIQFCIAERPATTPVSFSGAELAEYLAQWRGASPEDTASLGHVPGARPMMVGECMPRGLQRIEAVGSLLEMVAR